MLLILIFTISDQDLSVNGTRGMRSHQAGNLRLTYEPARMYMSQKYAAWPIVLFVQGGKVEDN
jgi:hypothetical protein